jgi:hypothetical protein
MQNKYVPEKDVSQYPGTSCQWSKTRNKYTLGFSDILIGRATPNEFPLIGAGHQKQMCALMEEARWRAEQGERTKTWLEICTNRDDGRWRIL